MELTNYKDDLLEFIETLNYQDKAKDIDTIKDMEQVLEGEYDEWSIAYKLTITYYSKGDGINTIQLIKAED